MRIAVFLLMMLLVCPVRAVILYSTDTRNTTQPTGSYTHSGWEFEGSWANFTGTAINKKYFITAEHIGGQVGQIFTLNGVNYTATATYDDPKSDLQIWKVNHLFPAWATLYRGNLEKGKGVVVYGRGTQRGNPIVVNAQTKGWEWGTDDRVLNWGRNVISDFKDGTADSGPVQVDKQQIYWTFDANGIPNEGAISLGDSGGGVFARIDKKWQLVGINLSSQSAFDYPGTSVELNGAIFDYGGLKVGGGIVNDVASDIPAKQFATRISGRISWIDGVLRGLTAPTIKLTSAPISHGVPEPSGLSAVIALAWSLKRPRRA